MNAKSLKIITYLYLIIPIMFFVIGWIKLQYAIISIFLLLWVLGKQIIENKEDVLIIQKKHIILIFFVVLFICILGGLGGFFYQSSDWNCRNAIFRDLINKKWPVYYGDSYKYAALSYYIGIWMVPAVLGKLVLLIAGSSVAWRIANIFLLLWSALGILLSTLWLIKILKVKSIRKILLVLFLFLGFSGLDFIGVFLRGDMEAISSIHLEWWAQYFQYSSMITQIFWVFNQAIVPWLITIIFMNEKRVNQYVLLILICFTHGPLPFLGLIPLMLVRGIKMLRQAIREKKQKEFWKDVFSLENVMSFIAIFPIYGLYYINNSAVQGNSGIIGIVNEALNMNGLKIFIEFYLLEIGIYGILLWKNNHKNELFITALITLLIVPFIQIGYEYDFCMRASIPAIIIVNCCLIKFIIEEFNKENINSIKEYWKKETKNFRVTLIICVFLIGCVTPFVEVGRGVWTTTKNKKLDMVADKIGSFENVNLLDYPNFVCINPKQNSKFFKYLAK